MGEVVVGDQSVQDAESRASRDQEPSAEQGHQGMGLALKALGQRHPTDLHVVGLLRQHRFDAGVDVLQVGLLAAGEVLSCHELGNELQPCGSRQGAAAGLQQNQMVVGRVAAVEVARVAGAGELLAVGGFPQGADRISDILKS